MITNPLRSSVTKRYTNSWLKQNRQLITFKDQVIFERDEILTGQGKSFTVFTPYKNAWLKQLNAFDLKPYPVETYLAHLAAPPAGLDRSLPTLKQLGFAPSNLAELKLPTGMSGAQHLLDDFLTRIAGYGERRDFPAVKGPSYLSMHLRFGTVSIRTLARLAHEISLQPDGQGAATWLSELIWRDFYFMILSHHPKLASGSAFKAEYDTLRWETGPQADAAFAAWCDGRTGYPLVDAAMLQLNQTGYMHNRLRMVTASFLVKDLGIDWRLGERYFAEQLNDFDFSANNGGWQWAASTGCDAQPYFRIFNPVTQSEKFDPEGRFIKRYLPQLSNAAAEVDSRALAGWRGSPGGLRGDAWKKLPGADRRSRGSACNGPWLDSASDSLRAIHPLVSTHMIEPQ